MLLYNHISDDPAASVIITAVRIWRRASLFFFVRRKSYPTERSLTIGGKCTCTRKSGCKAGGCEGVSASSEGHHITFLKICELSMSVVVAFDSSFWISHLFVCKNGGYVFIFHAHISPQLFLFSRQSILRHNL